MDETRPLMRRRTILAGMATVGLAGCGSRPAVSPITIPPEARCDRCGMQIHAHPGATAQVYLSEGSPHGREGPAWFDSSWEAYQYVFEHDLEASAWFVTDYSEFDPAITMDGGTPTIARGVDAESFRDAEGVIYVADSRVVGAMGRDLIGFGDRDDAALFQETYGGAITEHESVTPAVIGLLGR